MTTDKASIERALKYIEIACYPLFVWPLAKNASAGDVKFRKLAVFLSIANLSWVLFGLLFAVYHIRNDLSTVIGMLSESSACALMMIKILISHNDPTWQYVMGEMFKHVENIDPEDAKIIQDIVKRTRFLHGSIIIMGSLTGIVYVLSPLITSDVLPGRVEYPFSIEPFWTWLTMYVLQALGVVQVASISTIHVMNAIPVWYTVARFHMLIERFEKATTKIELRDAIKEHSELFEYADIVIRRMRRSSAATVIGAVGTITSAGFILIQGTDLLDTIKYICYEYVSMCELFIYAWPADNLISASKAIGDAAYGSAWIDQEIGIRKEIEFIVKRADKPLVISLSGLFPALTLEFYASTLSANIGYLSTLRVLTGNDGSD